MPLGLGIALEVEAVEQLVGRVPELAAAAELDRGDGDVHGVDEVGVEELADGRHAAAEAHVLAVGGGLRLAQGLGGRGVDEVEGRVRQREATVAGGGSARRPACGTAGRRPTSPATRGPPTGPVWGPNLLRPMISAPMLLAKSRVK